VAFDYLEKSIATLESSQQALSLEQADRLDCYKLDYVELIFELDLLNSENLAKAVGYLKKLNESSQRASIKVEFFLNECRRLLLLDTNKSVTNNQMNDLEAGQLRIYDETRIALYRSNRSQLANMLDVVQAMWDFNQTYFKPERKHDDSVSLLIETLAEINRINYVKIHLNKHVVICELIANLFGLDRYQEIAVLCKESPDSIGHFIKNISNYADTIYFIYVAFLNTGQSFNFKDLTRIVEYVSGEWKENVHFMLAHFYYKSGEFNESVKNLRQVTKRSSEHEAYLVASLFWNMCEENFERTNSRDLEFIQKADPSGDNEIISMYKYLTECLVNETNVNLSKEEELNDQENILLQRRILAKYLARKRGMIFF
jgi:tetratricopeptide (TPR) repeat protein